MGTPGLPGDPPKGPSRKSDEKVGSWALPGGVQISTKSDKNREKVAPRSALEGTSRKVLYKRHLGTPSDHENDGFVYTKPSFSQFHLEAQSD